MMDQVKHTHAILLGNTEHTQVELDSGPGVSTAQSEIETFNAS